MNWKLIFFPVAVVVEAVAIPLRGRELGFGNWVMDRHVGDPKGHPLKTRKEALKDQEIKSKQLPL